MKITELLLIVIFLSTTLCTESIVCTECRIFRDKILDLIMKFKDTNIQYVVDTCGLFMTLNECNFFINGIGNSAINNSYNFLKDSDYICSSLFCYDDTITKLKLEDFQKYLDKHFPKTEIIKKRKSDKDIKMIVVNDIHLQKDYKEQTVIDCGQIAGCCEARWGKPKKGEPSAGYWGTKNMTCDIPTRTFTKTLEFIKGRMIEIN